MAHVTFPFQPTEADCELAAALAEELDSYELIVLLPLPEESPAGTGPGLHTALAAIGDLAERIVNVLPALKVPSGLVRTVRP